MLNQNQETRLTCSRQNFWYSTPGRSAEKQSIKQCQRGDRLCSKFSGKATGESCGREDGTPSAGRLTSPNNVSSQAEQKSMTSAHYVRPPQFARRCSGERFPEAGQAGAGAAAAPSVVTARTAQYLHAEFSSALMGFVDGCRVRCWWPGAVIGDSLRSAAPAWLIPDLGVERKRAS